MTREEFLDAWASIAGNPPNPEQFASMDHAQGPLQITAGPGVGKTYALILRVLFLLCVSGGAIGHRLDHLHTQGSGRTETAAPGGALPAAYEIP